MNKARFYQAENRHTLHRDPECPRLNGSLGIEVLLKGPTRYNLCKTCTSLADHDMWRTRGLGYARKARKAAQ